MTSLGFWCRAVIFVMIMAWHDSNSHLLCNKIFYKTTADPPSRFMSPFLKHGTKINIGHFNDLVSSWQHFFLSHRVLAFTFTNKLRRIHGFISPFTVRWWPTTHQALIPMMHCFNQSASPTRTSQALTHYCLLRALASSILIRAASIPLETVEPEKYKKIVLYIVSNYVVTVLVKQKGADINNSKTCILSI